jgi:hypothetical protein
VINPDVTRHLHAMFDAHSAAFAAIRRSNVSLREANAAIGEANAAIGEASAAIGVANAAMGAAFDAHEEVINAALLANQAAIDMLDAMRNDQ